MSSKLDGIEDWPKLARQAAFHVDALARTCGVTRRHLDRYIQERFGKSARLWLTELRLREAAAMLLRGVPIKDVADKVGYTASAHFCRAFKQFYGRSPTAFRSLYRKKP